MSRPPVYPFGEAAAESEREGDHGEDRGCLADSGCCLLEAVATAIGGLAVLVALPMLMR